MDAQSRLSIQQAIDDKISGAEINDIFKVLNDAPEDDMIQRLSDLGIIDDLIKKVRSSSTKYPAHVTENKSSVLKFIDVQTDRVVESNTGLVPDAVDACKKYLLG
jgi:hypothetical protein